MDFRHVSNSTNINVCKGCHQEKSKGDFKTFLMHIGKQSNLLEISYLSHVSVGNELHVEMLTENCLLHRKQLNPSIKKD